MVIRHLCYYLASNYILLWSSSVTIKYQVLRKEPKRCPHRLNSVGLPGLDLPVGLAFGHLPTPLCDHGYQWPWVALEQAGAD